MKKKLKSVLALKEIVDKDYDEYMQHNGNINATIIGNGSEVEETMIESPKRKDKTEI